MIQNKTARQLMYDWHSGQSSPFYQAASAGICLSFSALADECARIDEPDRAKLMAWIQNRAIQTKPMVCVGGKFHHVLPWVSRTYFPATDRPLAAPGLTSYRAKSPYGWIMIGARDDAEAMREALRSTPNPSDLQKWNGQKYIGVTQ